MQRLTRGSLAWLFQSGKLPFGLALQKSVMKADGFATREVPKEGTAIQIWYCEGITIPYPRTATLPYLANRILVRGNCHLVSIRIRLISK